MLSQTPSTGWVTRMATESLAVARDGLARHARIALGYIGIYLSLEWLTHIHALEGLGVTLWNSPPAVSIALLLTRGFGYLPVLFAAALLASVFVHGGALSLSGKLLSCGALALGYAGLAFVLRQQRVSDVLRGNPNDILRLLLLVPLGALAIAMLNCGALVLTRDLSAGQFALATTHFWIGDTVGIITLLPALMAVVATRWPIATVFDRRLAMEVAVFVVGLAAALWLIFGLPGTDDHQFFYLLFLPVTWIAVRRGLVGAAFAILATHLALVIATEAVNSPTAGFMAFQLLMLALAAMTLLLGALVTDRRRWHEEVKAQQSQLGRMTRFSAGGAMGLAVAHQISQPLSTLGSYLHIAQSQLARGGGGVEVMQTLQTAASELKRSREILERLRDFVSQGKIQPEPVDLSTSDRRFVRSDACRGTRASGHSRTRYPACPGCSGRSHTDRAGHSQSGRQCGRRGSASPVKRGSCDGRDRVARTGGLRCR